MCNDLDTLDPDKFIYQDQGSGSSMKPSNYDKGVLIWFCWKRSRSSSDCYCEMSEALEKASLRIIQIRFNKFCFGRDFSNNPGSGGQRPRGNQQIKDCSCSSSLKGRSTCHTRSQHTLRVSSGAIKFIWNDHLSVKAQNHRELYR